MKKTISKKMKEASVLLIAVVMLLSTVAVTADTTDESPELMLAGADYISQSQQTNTFDSDWIHFDDGTNIDSIGLTDGGTFEFGIRITPTELAGYDTWILRTVKWHHGMKSNPQPSHSGTIKIYDAGTSTKPGSLITSEAFTTAASSEWETTTLSSPVTINESNDIWVTVRVTHAAGEFPAGVGPGPVVPGKGGWITLDGTTWEQLGIDITSLDYNWNLWAGIDDGTQPAVPNLDCDGTLSWTDVEPCANVNGTFTVENIGEADSLLNWEIDSYPDWGTWNFDPDGGTGLPKGAPITVDVEIVAPKDPETEFTGEIVLVNSEDPDDTCTIDVSLATPVSQHSLISLFFEKLAERFPFLALILEAIF